MAASPVRSVVFTTDTKPASAEAPSADTAKDKLQPCRYLIEVQMQAFRPNIEDLASSMLSQSAYMLAGVILILIVSLLDIPNSIRLNLSAFVPVDVVDPSRLHVFIYRFLESVDIPSVVALVLWGRGLAAIQQRNRSWGIRLCFSIYIIGILLISLPVMFAPAS